MPRSIAALRVFACYSADTCPPLPVPAGIMANVLRVSGQRLVGRDGELRRLLDLLDDAAEGRRPTHALISGDAGVGKTRLVSELAGRAAGRGFTVLSGRCAELGDSIPYLPLLVFNDTATTG